MNQIFLFPEARRQDPAVAAWMKARPGELGAIAQHWFQAIKALGEDVHELLHDGHPTACVRDGAFAYVNAFRDHVNLGFFRGSELPDPAGLLEGVGKRMRHVKLRPGAVPDAAALQALIGAAYEDMKRRIDGDSQA